MTKKQAPDIAQFDFKPDDLVVVTSIKMSGKVTRINDTGMAEVDTGTSDEPHKRWYRMTDLMHEREFLAIKSGSNGAAESNGSSQPPHSSESTRESDQALVASLVELKEDLERQLDASKSALQQKQEYIDSLLKQADQNTNIVEQLRREKDAAWDALYNQRTGQTCTEFDFFVRDITLPEQAVKARLELERLTNHDGWTQLYTRMDTTEGHIMFYAQLVREIPPRQPQPDMRAYTVETDSAAGSLPVEEDPDEAPLQIEMTADMLKTFVPGQLIVNALPVANAIRTKGAAAVIAEQNAVALDAGRSAFQKRMDDLNRLYPRRQFGGHHVVTSTARTIQP